MASLKRPYNSPVLVEDHLRDEVKSVLEYVGQEDMMKNLNQAILAACGRFLLGDIQLSVASERRKALQTISVLLRVMNAAVAEGIGIYRPESTLTKCTVTLALSELRDSALETDNTISLLCDVLRQSLLLMDQGEKEEWISILSSECENALCAGISKELNEDPPTLRPEACLRILEVVLESIDASSCRKNSELEDEYKSPTEELSPLISTCNLKLHQIFIQLVLGQNEGLRAHLLVVLIPLTVKVEGSVQLLRELWDALCALDGEDDGFNSVGIVCALSDHFLPEDGRCRRLKCFPLVDRPKFWRLLQNGICAQQPLTRKQSLYLLKRAIDGLSRNGKQINITEFEWNVAKSNQLQAAWHDLFLVLEALEETQAHLVRPVLSILGRLLNSHNTSNACISLPWLLCAFQRVLLHSSPIITMWGIKSLLGPDGSMVLASNEAQTFTRFILKTLLPVLNSSVIFSSEGGLLKVLCEFFSSASRQKISKTFFSRLLHSMSALPWGPVPLFHIVEALSQTPSVSCWDHRDLKELRKIVAVTLATQSVVIRAATQSRLLLCMIHLIDSQHVDLDTLCDVVSAFRRDECLHRGTEAWFGLVGWLCKHVESNDALKWLLKVRENPNRLCGVGARFIILLLDACKLDTLDTLKPLLESIKDCDTRLYACQETQNNCITLLAHLLQESEALQKCPEKDLTRDIVISLVGQVLTDVVTLTRVRLNQAQDMNAFHIVNTFLPSLEILFMDPATVSLISSHGLLSMLNDALNALKSSSEKAPLQTCCAASIFKICAAALENSHVEIGRNIIVEAINLQVMSGQLGRPLITQRNSKLPQELLELQGPLVSLHTQVVWELLAVMPDVLKEWDEEKVALALEAAGNAIEFGGRATLAHLLQALKPIFCKASVSLQSTALHLLERCWNAVMELRRNELFWGALEAFVSMLMQPPIILDNGWAGPYALQCCRELFQLGDSVCGVANLVVTSLQSLADASLQGLLQSPLRENVITALIFGPVHRKDQRTINETCDYIASLGERCAVNVLLSVGDRSDGGVRAGAVQILARLSLANESPSGKLAGQLVRDLLECNKEPELRRPRYFGDSQIHRCKHRILQGILLLEPCIPQEMRKTLMEWATESLLNENHQPSVRYQTEWLLVRLLSTLPEEIPNLWINFTRAVDLRAGAVCSLIGVILHTALMMQSSNRSINEIETFLEGALEALLPCTMAQHFNVRLHAQVAILQLWNTVEELSLKNIGSRYEVVVRGVMSSLQQASGAGHTRHQQDFYFHAFHPAFHYTLQTIYEDLPRLANVTRDEWITVDQLSLSGVRLSSSHLPLRNSNIKLKDFNPSPWVQRPSTGNVSDSGESVEAAVLQKKMIPWKWMDPTEELIQSLPDSLQQVKLSAEPGQQLQKPSLVVVASLIDKAPNLGGLARTCEIMGASLVLPSLSCAQDREFKALSMSAEMWIPMCEVKPFQLSQFLADMKSVGYKLVGAEQTAGSTPLQIANFSPHTLLLLGNEREGIPANLLPLLDQCVEVPQCGVVRSLNVHVTGALFMWQYACQNYFSKTPVKTS